MIYRSQTLDVFCGLCVEACPKDAIRMDTGVISMAHTSRHSFDFTRDLLRDTFDSTDQPNHKYDDSDIPSPSEKKDALPNSNGVPVP